MDKHCVRVLSKKWPSIYNYGDVRTADFSGIRGGVDVISAGVPCQPSSIAGASSGNRDGGRRGASDNRWLWPETLDVVGSLQPTWCIFENPIGILSLDEFQGILLRLEKIGYEKEIFEVPANAVGAAHSRYRVFIIAHNKSMRRSGLPLRASTPYPMPGGVRKTSSRDSGSALGRGSKNNGNTHEERPRNEMRIRFTQSPLCGRDDGISNRSHRIRALGNSVCPQQAYPFFRAIQGCEENC